MSVVIMKKVNNDKARWENLRLLAYEHGSQESLAGKLGLSGEKIAKFFKDKPAVVSDSFARSIEKKLAKPHGWMDRKNFDLALTSDEWYSLESYRQGSNRDRIILSSLANSLGAIPEGE